MSAGFAVFIVCDVAGAIAAAAACVHTARTVYGHAWMGEAAVLGLSVAIFTAACLWLGYSLAAQILAAVLSCVPLLAGRRYLTMLTDFRGEDR